LLRAPGALGLLIALAQKQILSEGELLQELAQAAKLAGQEISNAIMQMWLPMPMKVALGLMMMELGEGADKPVPENVGPGTNAGDSVPAGPSARPTKEQQGQINDIGNVDGCHTCGTTDPGTKSGNWVGDHQPPTALNPQGKPQSYYPQCRE
jgi:hypothetical protein